MAGDPVPEVSWYKNKKKLKKSKRTKIETNAETGVCTLEIRETKADDSGEYTVELANDVSFRVVRGLQRPTSWTGFSLVGWDQRKCNHG